MGDPKDWGWRIDPSVKGDPRSVLAPEGHPRRCQGRIRFSQPPRQCSKYALVGRRYCRTHGGHSHKNGFNARSQMRYYSKHAGPILAKKLAELKESGPDERHSLAEEIDVARVVTDRYVRLYEKLVMDEDSQASPDAKAAVASGLRESLSHVSQIVQAAAKVHAVHEATFDAEQLGFVIQQVVKAVEEVVAEENRQMADRLIARLQEIRMPARAGKRGTPEGAEEIRRALREAETSVPGGEAA